MDQVSSSSVIVPVMFGGGAGAQFLDEALYLLVSLGPCPDLILSPSGLSCLFVFYDRIKTSVVWEHLRVDLLSLLSSQLPSRKAEIK